MRAKTVNENYPWGAENDPRAPWNEPEDDSQYELDMDGNELIITRGYNFSGEYEWDADTGYVDMEEFANYAAQKLGLDVDEKYNDDDFLEILGWTYDDEDKPNKINFQTSWGNFQISMDELIDMSNLF
jgi:hypothetical protein